MSSGSLVPMERGWLGLAYVSVCEIRNEVMQSPLHDSRPVVSARMPLGGYGIYVIRASTRRGSNCSSTRLQTGSRRKKANGYWREGGALAAKVLEWLAFSERAADRMAAGESICLACGPCRWHPGAGEFRAAILCSSKLVPRLRRFAEYRICRFAFFSLQIPLAPARMVLLGGAV